VPRTTPADNVLYIETQININSYPLLTNSDLTEVTRF